jgi:hypothetical protein
LAKKQQTEVLAGSQWCRVDEEASHLLSVGG